MLLDHLTDDVYDQVTDDLAETVRIYARELHRDELDSLLRDAVAERRTLPIGLLKAVYDAAIEVDPDTIRVNIEPLREQIEFLTDLLKAKQT